MIFFMMKLLKKVYKCRKNVFALFKSKNLLWAFRLGTETDFKKTIWKFNKNDCRGVILKSKAK